MKLLKSRYSCWQIGNCVGALVGQISEADRLQLGQDAHRAIRKVVASDFVMENLNIQLANSVSKIFRRS